MTRRVVPHAPREEFEDVALFTAEVVVDEGTGILYVGDGVTPGGNAVNGAEREITSILDLGGIRNVDEDDVGGDAVAARAVASAANAAALLSAIDLGRDVYFPKGRYWINEQVTWGNRIRFHGDGEQRSTLVFGAAGQIKFEGTGAGSLLGFCSMSDMGLAMADDISSVSAAALVLKHAEHIHFDRCLFYHLLIDYDNVHYIVHNDCKYYGGITGSKLVCQCVNSGGSAFISESPEWVNCFRSGFPMDFTDTVEARHTNCKIFGGAYGDTYAPFYVTGPVDKKMKMGPIITSCTYDAIEGRALNINHGGINSSIIGSWFSGGRDDDLAGVLLSNSNGMRLVGNEFFWCGTAGLQLAACDGIMISGNVFKNNKDGPGILSAGSQNIIITANSFANEELYGGSAPSEDGNTGMSFAIETNASDADGYIVTGNTAKDLLEAGGCYIVGGGGTHNVVRDNPGFPYSSEQGWPSGITAARPTGVADGFMFYDATLGYWIYWNAVAVAWRKVHDNSAA